MTHRRNNCSVQSSAVNEVNLHGRIAAGIVDGASVNLSDGHDV